MCGVVGIIGNDEAANHAYLALHALQHRGQESAGIVSTNGYDFHEKRGMGLVHSVFPDKSALARLTGHAAIGHARYSTAGNSCESNIQPLLAKCQRGKIAIAHNGNLINAQFLREKLETRGSIFSTTTDTEVILHLIAGSRAESFSEALLEALGQIKGAFSLVILTADALYAVRDPQGFRPLVIGRFENSWTVASEACAFDLLGVPFLRKVEPGEVVKLSAEGLESIQFAEPNPQHCIFELVYFSRPDSEVFDRSVLLSREKLGRNLAREHPVTADVVVPIPDSGVAAATGYSLESGIPLRMGIIRNHYTGRTFIEPEQRIRDFGIRLKLNAVRSVLSGKRVVLIDDSIVRGTTSGKVVRMVKAAGATEVHMRITCPPTISPCYYGIDTPRAAELIAANQGIEAIRESIGADSLGYLSLQGLCQGAGQQKEEFCLSCFTGKHPLLHQIQKPG